MGANPFAGRIRAESGLPSLDTDEVRRALDVMLDPAGYAQLQALPLGEWANLPCDDREGQIRWLSGRAGSTGLYVSLNPVKQLSKPIRAGDVVRRRWLLVDLDAKRADRDSNSSEAEHEATHRTACDILDDLCDSGWPLPVVVDSGNGYHLLWRVDLPNDDRSRQLLRKTLHALASRYDSDGVEVDKKTHNANRITKIPGTWARKGPDTPERPHRLARIVGRIPDPLEVVTAEQLEALAGPVLTEPVSVERMPARSPLAGSIRIGDQGDPRRYAMRALELETAKVASAPGGIRNTTLFEAALKIGNFIGSGLLDEATVSRELLWAAGSAGLGEREAQATIASGIERGRQNPRSAPERNGTVPTATAPAEPQEWPPLVPLAVEVPAAPFPVEQVFPPSLARHAQEVAYALSCPVDFVAVPMLAAVSGAIGNTRRLEVLRTHRQPALLFCCIIGSPGTAKSPAIDLVMQPLEAAQHRYTDEYITRRDAYRTAKEEAKENGEPAPSPPAPMRRLLINDTTQEALVSILAENPRGSIMVRDELAALIRGMDQYRAGGKGNDRQNFLSMWSQTTIRNDRKGNPDGCPVTVRMPFLAVVGGTQPGIVSSLRGEARKDQDRPPDDGLVDRFLFAFPEHAPVSEETWRQVPEQSLAAWQEVIERLLLLQMVGEGRDARPALIHLTDCGKDAWTEFTRQHAAEVNAEGFEDYLAGPWSKLRGYCLRLALVLHSLWEAEPGGSGWRDGIDRGMVERAALLTDYFKQHARRVLHSIDADRVGAQARKILEHLRRNGIAAIKVRQLYQDLHGSRFPSMDAFDRPLKRLVEHGYLRQIPGDRQTGGRPEADHYEVNPAAWDEDEE